ncbi:MAG: metal ABC transporter permease [Anaerolineae bacterium]|nr:metal ABC transporter permease [Anaerolineae bacterium]
MFEWLIAPFNYAFMVRGLAAGIMVGILCSIIGCYVVLRSMAFLGDALAHAILPGVAIAYLLKGNLVIGALIAAVIVALGVGIFSRRGAIKEDTAIGIMFTAALALGVALISSIRTYAVDLSHILFGNMLGVSNADLWLIGGLGVAVLFAILIFYRPFLLISFDPIHAATLRLPVELLRTFMLILLSLTIVVSIQTVGVALAAAMLVTPAASAYLLTKRLPSMMLIAACIGAFSSLIGLYISFYAGIASGSAVVLTATFIFILTFLLAPQRGYLWAWLNLRRPRPLHETDTCD